MHHHNASYLIVLFCLKQLRMKERKVISNE